MFIETSFLYSKELKLVLTKTVSENAEKDWLPAYHFAICDKNDNKMGSCDLRIGYNQNVYYGGNIGYQIDESYRGHHFAGKACLLLFQLARKHNMNDLIITCNPDNYASRKTCKYAGGTLLEIIKLPVDNDMYIAGETEKCIYKFELNKSEY